MKFIFIGFYIALMIVWHCRRQGNYFRTFIWVEKIDQVSAFAWNNLFLAVLFIDMQVNWMGFGISALWLHRNALLGSLLAWVILAKRPGI